jgi:signal peptidase
MAIFHTEEARAAGRLDGSPDASPDGAELTRDQMIEEAEAIEAAWLATRENPPATPVVSLHAATTDAADNTDAPAPVAVGPLHAAALQSSTEPESPSNAQEDLPSLHSSSPQEGEGRAAAGVRFFGPPNGGRRRALRFAWSFFSWAGVIAVAAAMIAIAAVIVVPRAMGWQGMVILSGSMEPDLPVGGLAFVESLSQDELAEVQPGDIITFETGRLSSLISHRVVEVIPGEDGPSFITKGDANTAPDGAPIAAERVVGQVRYDLPYLGRVVEKLQNRSTYYLFIGIPAALLIATELWNIVKEVRRYRAQSLSKGRREQSAETNAEGAYS